MNKFFMTLSLILALPSIVLSSDKPEFSGFLPGYNGSQLPIQYLPGTTPSVESVTDTAQEALISTTDTHNLKEMGLIIAGVIGTGISFSRFPKTTTATLFGLGLWKNEKVREYPTTTALALAGAACIWAFCKTKELFKEYTYATELTQDHTQIEAYQITAFIKQNPRIAITTTRTANLNNLYEELTKWITTNIAFFDTPNQTLIIETSLKLKSDYVRRTLKPIEINLTALQTQATNRGITLKNALFQIFCTHLAANITDIHILLNNQLLDNTTAQATISRNCIYQPLTKKTITQTITTPTVVTHNVATNQDVQTFITRTFELLKQHINDKDADKELEIVITFTKNDHSGKVFSITPITIRTNGKQLFENEGYDIAKDRQHSFFTRSKRYNAVQEIITNNLWNQHCQQALGNHYYIQTIHF